MPKAHNLTDRALKSAKAAPDGTTYDIRDGVVPGLFARVSPKGRKTFVLISRFNGAKQPTRRALGVYGAITLDAARIKARKWIETVQRGEDPARQEERERLERVRQQKITFAAVVADFIKIKLADERKGEDAEREINRDLIPHWAALPVTEISDEHIIKIITEKAAKSRDSAGRIVGGKVGARNLLALIKRFFRWVVDRRIYGLTRSPCETLSASKILGEDVSTSRERTLSQDELWALWHVTLEMPYPVGPAYRLLMLAALRLSEATNVQRNEFDPLVLQAIGERRKEASKTWHAIPANRAIWTIPKERMKGKNTGKKKARAHVVPLTNEIFELFASLPEMAGQFLFSTTAGSVPVSIGTKVKAEVDRRMLIKLRGLAVSRGQNPDDVTLPHWTNHDIRRTVRSHLSQLRVEEVVREALLAHSRKGIEATYDQHTYLEEKRAALQLWAQRLLRTIVESAHGNVVPIKAMISG
jgi:hypothetical protein